jgi:hypothetical protein
MSENDSTSGLSGRARQFRGRLCRVWLGLATLCFVLPASVQAQSTTPNAAPKPQPDRWLLVIDTSDAMGRRARALEGVIGELLVSSMNGQMAAGSQVGIWTYNKDLNTGIVPLQTWNPGQSNRIAGRTAQFIGTLKFQSKSSLDGVMPQLNRVVKDSRRLTVVIFSDGSHKIAGTPYDEALNDAYAAARPDMKNTRMPLVTVLRSEKGKFIGQNVSFAPWPISFPPFEPEPEPVVKPVAPVKPKPVQPAKSIIIGSGPKPTQPGTNQIVLTPAPEIKPVTEIPISQPPAITTPKPPPPQAVPAAAINTQAVVVAITSPPIAAIDEPRPTESPMSAAITTPATDSDSSEATSFLSRKWLLILGIGCMWVAIITALLLVRRSRRATSASLITQSFERDRR